MKKYFTNTIFIAGFLFSVIMFLFFIYANCNCQFNLFNLDLVKSNELLITDFKHKKKTKYQKIKKQVDNIVQAKVDTTHKRFLLIGDSQVGGLMYPFYNYCKYNGHDLALALVCNSARDVTFANNDTLKLLIEKYKPDHIVLVVGLNQVFQDRFSKSELAIEKILSTFNGIPYSWVGPASWIPDNGITECYRNNLDVGCFYASDKLILDRGNDGRHPSPSAYYIWMDSIAQWMQNESIYHIKMQKPLQFNANYAFTHRSFNAGRVKKDPITKIAIDTSSVKVIIDSLGN